MATQGTQDEKQQHTTPYVLDTSIRKQKQITWGKDKIIEYPDHKPLQAIIVASVTESLYKSIILHVALEERRIITRCTFKF